jgi:hypothetical protein
MVARDTMHGTKTPGATLRKLGIVVLTIGYTSGGAIYFYYGGADSGDPRALIGVLVMLVGGAGTFLHVRGRQLAARAAAESLGKSRSALPSVLYLRAFRTDPNMLRAQIATEEEQLAFVLQPFGRLIAIGRPAERLPPPGAVRLYATDDKWRRVVSRRLRSARLTVIRAGATESLFWEVERAFSIVSPENLLILVLNLPLGDYREFAGLVRGRCSVVLPSLVRAGVWRRLFWSFKPKASHAMPGFIGFGPDWTATFYPLPFTLGQMNLNDLRKPFNLALRPLFEERGVAWRPVGRWTRNSNAGS